MGLTDTFRRQHKEIMEIASQMNGILEPDLIKNNSAHARKLLARLAGKLKMHLAMEDEVLYPQLLKHDDEQVHATAKQFNDEMGGLFDAFRQYMEKWPNQEALDNNPHDFVDETKKIFQALAKRVEKEDTQLYPLLDAMEK